jgi:general stress protein 26
MTTRNPLTELDPRYSTSDATATPWTDATKLLESAEIYWISSVRPEGRPHVTPMMAIWQHDALYFSTGAEERKNLNLVANPHCVITTGCNKMQDEAIDIVLEGEAVRIEDDTTLQRLAEAYRTKYGWEFTPRDGKLHGDEGNVALVYAVKPTTAFGFGKGNTFSQTRWRFTE